MSCLVSLDLLIHQLAWFYLFLSNIVFLVSKLRFLITLSQLSTPWEPSYSFLALFVFSFLVLITNIIHWGFNFLMQLYLFSLFSFWLQVNFDFDLLFSSVQAMDNELQIWSILLTFHRHSLWLLPFNLSWRISSLCMWLFLVGVLFHAMFEWNLGIIREWSPSLVVCLTS